MLAETLALALVLAAPGSPRARPAIDPPPDSSFRARRGLLPRKVVKVRPPGRARRVILLPQAPTWLGEPGEVTGPVLEAEAPALEEQVEPASFLGGPPGEPPVVSAALGEAEVELLLVRRLAPRRLAPSAEPLVQAAVAEPEVQAVLVRRRPLAP